MGMGLFVFRSMIGIITWQNLHYLKMPMGLGNKSQWQEQGAAV
jgi:hypothetical protein